MADKKKCFIIMPITTPENMIDIYHDGKDHFKHVLDTLFIPSVENAGYKAIPPSAEGSDMIHANIIKNLETADLVLCDTSCLNANVFFEFGIRTSVNKPIALVRDDYTKMPFDSGILQHHKYKSVLGAWEIEDQRERLKEHILNVEKKSDGQNLMWKYFGMRTESRLYHSKSGKESEFELLKMQLEILTNKIDSIADNFGEPTGMVDQAPKKRIRRRKFPGDVSGSQYIVQSLGSKGIKDFELNKKNKYHYQVIFEGSIDKPTEQHIEELDKTLHDKYRILLETRIMPAK